MRHLVVPSILALTLLAGCQTGAPSAGGGMPTATVSGTLATAWVDCVGTAYQRARPAPDRAETAFASCARQERAMAANIAASTGQSEAAIIATYRAQLRPVLVERYG